MCIICSTDDEHQNDADNFLMCFSAASASMKAAEKALLSLAPFTDKKDHYLKLHKQLVKARKAWNKLEQKREEKNKYIDIRVSLEKRIYQLACPNCGTIHQEQSISLSPMGSVSLPIHCCGEDFYIDPMELKRKGCTD